MNICTKVNTCPTVNKDLRSRDWPSDAYFAQAVRKMCSTCNSFEKAKNEQ